MRSHFHLGLRLTLLRLDFLRLDFLRLDFAVVALGLDLLDWPRWVDPYFHPRAAGQHCFPAGYLSCSQACVRADPDCWNLARVDPARLDLAADWADAGWNLAGLDPVDWDLACSDLVACPDRLALAFPDLRYWDLPGWSRPGWGRCLPDWARCLDFLRWGLDSRSDYFHRFVPEPDSVLDLGLER